MGKGLRNIRVHSLWLVFGAALLPLLVLLGLQAIWLDRLEETSLVAQRAALRNALDSVATEVEYFYRSAGERLLNVPAGLLVEGRPSAVSGQWRTRDLAGIRRLYLVDYTRSPTGNFYAFDPEAGSLGPTTATDESLAVVIACLPYQPSLHQAGPPKPFGLQVNEQDPAQRIVLSPIQDGRQAIVGVAVMILDEDYLRRVLLPAAIDRALSTFFPEAAPGQVTIEVRDQDGRPALAAAGDTAGMQPRPEVARRLSFVFGDWTLGLLGTGVSTGGWARGSFAFNMILAVLLAGVLLLGIVMTLRTAGRAMNLSQLKSDFVSNVSHELRSPLAAIRLFAEHLRQGRATTPEKVREYGEYIELESERLSRLVDNILDFARIDSGRKTYRFAPASLAELVQAVVRSLRTRLERQGFELAVELPAAELAPIELDTEAVGQALSNLLDNAAKYSAEDKRIAVRLWSEGGWQAVAVSDHGIGIPRAEQERIFERFHRVGSCLVHDVKGSGLGLSIVQHVVQAHGGRVSVDSQPGRGSTFTIRLPAVQEKPT